MDRVDARIGGFADGVGGAVHDVDIIAKPTNQGVDAVTATEAVGGAVAGDHVVQGVADAVDGGSTGEGEVLHVGKSCQGEGHAGEHRVDAGSGRFADGVEDGVHDVGVVAGSTDQAVVAGAAIESVVASPTVEGVVAGAAIKGVVATVAGDHVVAGIAGAVVVGSTAKDEVLKVGGKGIGEAADHGVDACACRFHHHIGGPIHPIGVIAGATDQGVAAGATIEGVVATVAGDHVGIGVAGAGEGCTQQGEVFQVCTEDIIHRAVHLVGAGGGGLQHHVQAGIHAVGVVADTARHRIVAHPPIEGVVAGTTIEAVVAQATNQVVVADQAQGPIIAGGAGEQVGGNGAGVEIAHHLGGSGDHIFAGASPIHKGNLHPQNAAHLVLGRGVGRRVRAHHRPGGAIVGGGFPGVGELPHAVGVGDGSGVHREGDAFGGGAIADQR